MLETELLITCGNGMGLVRTTKVMFRTNRSNRNSTLLMKEKSLRESPFSQIPFQQQIDVLIQINQNSIAEFSL